MENHLLDPGGKNAPDPGSATLYTGKGMDPPPRVLIRFVDTDMLDL
jgi:hypothetical protein